jgi:hypothetical protein
MACPEAIQLTVRQTANIPIEAKRLVVPVGSGLTLAGVLAAVVKTRRRLPVLGVVVGADPTRRLDKWAPPGWPNLVKLQKSGVPYWHSVTDSYLGDVPLDPTYEAKCVAYLAEGDCLWVVGHRRA